MLKIPEISFNKNKNLIKDPNMEMLFKELQKQESYPNIITLDVFRQFEPLFRKDSNLTREKVEELTLRYKELIDFYKETQIIVSATNPTVMLTLPPIFTPVRSLEQTEKNASLVAANATMANSNVPKYTQDAFFKMFIALRSEQTNNSSVVEEYKMKYLACIQQFYDTYNKNKDQNVSTTTEEVYQPIDTITEWE